MVVDAQVERRPFLLAVDQQRGGLLAALVAAGGLARPHRGDQAAREGQAVIGDIGLRGLVEHVGPASMLPATEKPLPAMCPHQSTQSRAGMRGDAPLASIMWIWRLLAAVVGREQGGHDVVRVQALAQQLDAVDAVVAD